MNREMIRKYCKYLRNSAESLKDHVQYAEQMGNLVKDIKVFKERVKQTTGLHPKLVEKINKFWIEPTAKPRRSMLYMIMKIFGVAGDMASKQLKTEDENKVLQQFMSDLEHFELELAIYPFPGE